MSNRFKSLLIIALVFASLFYISSPALAAVDTGINQIEGSINLSSNSPLNVAVKVINILLGLLGLIAVSLMLWGGFIYLTSGGSEDKISQAKKILRNAAIGLLIILSAWGIVFFIFNKLLGVTGGNGGGGDGCSNGAVVSCGCGGAQTCNNGNWGSCLGSACNPIINENASCDGKSVLGGCQADNNLCGADYTCDESSCLCKPKASLGESCNAGLLGACSADDSLCGPYLKCDPNSCVCTGPPVITGVSPAGGFCVNDTNRGCSLDSDCLNGAKCDTLTPNGTANNFVTIYGYNFGTSSNAFGSIITASDFENGSLGSAPVNWKTVTQKHSAISLVANEFKTGKRSVRLHQDANLNWPGTCTKVICDDLLNCTWNSANKTCSFPNTDSSHPTAPAVYNEGQNLISPNSYNVMWGKLSYNLAALNLTVGDTYSIQFYYKGKTAANIAVKIAADINNATQCVSYATPGALKSGYSWNGTKLSPTLNAGEDPCASGFGKTCANQTNTCCLNSPQQKECYSSLNLSSISQGEFSDWTLYSYTFQYTPELASWLDASGNKLMEFGLLMDYGSTGSGTDLYIDDFSVTKILNTGQVTFLGANSSQSQLAIFPKVLNPNCVSYWTDRQITVAVPSGAASGPIQIKREGDSSDATDVTDNDLGPKINNFVKNNIYRPGICQISPNQGTLGSKVAYQGINLKNSVAYFGSYNNSYKGINSVFVADNLSGQALAPSIAAGETTTFVERDALGINQKSNTLVFIKERDPEAGPYISSFYPNSGPVGQYVTITGSGFGNMRGSRQVFFGDKEASYDFPAVCANSVWSDSQIIVKVPSGLTTGSFEIKINLGDTTINTDLLSPNNTFKFDPAEVLKTSLCKIDPIRGQIGDKVSLWGEYFGSSGTNALIVFNRGVNVSSKILKDGLADKLETTVPIDTTGTPAITGPVKVMKNGLWGNELNFTVGKCVSDSECNSSSPVCCPGNTFKTGSCAASVTACYFDVPKSVYETKFNTVLSGGTTDPDNAFDSCIAMASFFGGCQTGQFCPNSPGKCSPFSPIAPEILGDCGANGSECGAIDYCKNNPSACSYNSEKDVCQTKSCVLDKEYNYSLSSVVNGKNISTNYKGSFSCRLYNDGKTEPYFVKQLKVNTSCPDNYTSIGGGYCIDNTPVLCSPCNLDFSCAEDANLADDFGVCQSTKICGNGATCKNNPNDLTKYSCLKTQDKSCDCCCEIGQDARDCCAPLTCGGTCGSDTTDNNEGYGSCSGCSAVGTTQAENDAACNCASTSGKICQNNICVDCAALDENGCAEHTGQCCFDSLNGVCQGGDGSLLPGGKCAYYDCDVDDKTTCNQSPSITGQFLATSTCVANCNGKTACDLAGSDVNACSIQENCCFDSKTKTCKDGGDKISLDGVNYCSYYDCDEATETCNAVASTTGEVLGLAKCNESCKSNDSLPGLSCASESVAACNSAFCSNPYTCMAGENSSTNDCGVCCCVPGTEENGLTCLADKGNCTGAGRGLLCGCEADAECGANSQGCGGDTCCHARPSITSTNPKNNDTGVCRNRQIEITFNQEMNSSMMASNVLLLEEKEYGVDTCANGTTLAFNDSRPQTTNFIAKIYYSLISVWKNIFNQASALEPANNKLYCITPATINSEVSYTGNATSTKIYLKPQTILAPDTNYFVLIKGDEALDSNSGVMSLEKVGLNGALNSPIDSRENSNKVIFNGTSFKNSYAFSFKTLEASSNKSGLCVIDSVVVKPSSYLIKTTENDTSDDSPLNVDTFDTKADSDKVFSALAYSADKQLLQSVTGYSWAWQWSIEDSSVASRTNASGLPDNQIMLSAVTGVTDKNTKVNAKVDMNGFSNFSFVGNGSSGLADLYVFLCNNPWPAAVSGIWSPWADKNYDSSGNLVTNYNYKFYYCRDAGEPGTADDLPVVADPALILGTSGGMICSNTGTTCKTSADCNSSGTCIWSVLKESYFFRDAVPQAGEITQAQATGVSGQVSLTWRSPINQSDPVTSFKVYYGLSSGKASSFISTLTLNEASCYQDAGNNFCSYKIDGLSDGVAYTFKISALTDKKTESSLSGAREITPQDKTAPGKPNGLNITASGEEIIVSWQPVDGASYYRLFHGILPGKRAADSVDSADKANRIVLKKSDYRVGDHYFYLAAIDKANNISDTSSEIKMVILDKPNNLQVVQKDDGLSITWDNNYSLANYSFVVYAGQDADNLSPLVNTGKYPFYLWSKSKYSSGEYFFSVSVKNDQGVESAKANVFSLFVK